MPIEKETKIYRIFIISVSLITAMTLSVVFLNMAIRTRQLINEENLMKARQLFNSIVLTRKWSADYGGVYVEKKEGVLSNPYLENPDIKTIDGKIYTLRNPALMTKEISQYAQREGLFIFHITSLKLINPNNKPDEFERKALHLFENGEKEVSQVELINNRRYFRFMAPLYIEKACLKCHLKQGYKIGDLRGGISLSFDIEDNYAKLKRNTLSIIFSGITATAALLWLIYFFTRRLTKKVSAARQEIEKMAITDGLTGVFNRRHLMSRFEEEFERSVRLKKGLGCIILDIDNFKSINDTYGHLFGDEVLKEVSNRVSATIRVYDILGRSGGDEFMIVLPDSNFEDIKEIAERMRRKVKEDLIQNLDVTISLGISCMHEADKSIKDIIKRADQGFYKAKNTGRDRVEWIEV